MMQTSKAEGMLEDGGSDLVGGSAGNGSLEQVRKLTPKSTQGREKLVKCLRDSPNYERDELHFSVVVQCRTVRRGTRGSQVFP